MVCLYIFFLFILSLVLLSFLVPFLILMVSLSLESVKWACPAFCGWGGES